MPKVPSKKIIERRQRVEKILTLLKREYPDAKCALDHRSPLELIVATILSAQCTDVRVNIVTKDLFRKYRSADDYARARQETFEKEIRSTGFFRNKTRSVRAMAQALVKEHGGKVPQTMEELTDLPGVGRKTANVVLGTAFNQNVGIVVDTHVTRLSNRLGLTRHKSDAVKIEHDLMQVVPQEEWTMFSHLLIHHGRSICQARNPKCDQCQLFSHCPAGQKFMRASGSGT
jgi:endonuclease-3